MHKQVTTPQEAVPQLSIRSNLKSGASMESCQNNVNYWQQDFTNWYNQAIKNGYYPPFPNPVPTLY